jgi:hypothetical protein
MKIPEEVVELAAKRYLLTDGTAYICMLSALEVATPHILAGLVAMVDDHITALEATPVEEYEYPALCAQREAYVGVLQMLQEMSK